MNRRSQGLIDVGLLLMLAVMWGSAFPFIEEALTGFDPAAIAAGRITLAAILLSVMARMRGERVTADPRARWRLAWAGILGASLPFLLIAWGQQRVTAAESATLMAFTPLATALLAHLFLKEERLGGLLLSGLILGIAGVATLAGLPEAIVRNDILTPAHLLADGAILLGAFGYAASSILLRTVRNGGAIAHAAAMMRAAALVSLVAAPAFSSWPEQPPLPAVLALVELGLVPSGIAAIVLVRLLQRRSPNFVALNNFLVPPVGVALGVVWLGESVTTRQLIGLFLLLLALALAEAGRRRAQPRPR
ncbi:MAG: DMT family transporter [Alphaproteobacteria bacterium]|nr:MAG: DMT family transporter [Alphaproteobacteria bacterium]